MYNYDQDNLGVLSDIIKVDAKKQSANQVKSIFNNYVEKKVIADKILESFIQMYDKEHKAFPLDDRANSKKFGVITHCMAVSTFLELDSLDANISKYNDVFYTLIENLFASVYNSGSLIFDASPYLENNEKFLITSYVETLSKVIIVMCDLRDRINKQILNNQAINFKITIREQAVSDNQSLLKEVEELLINAIKKLNASCLKCKEGKEYKVNGKKIVRNNMDASINYRGWNFQQPSNGEEDEYGSSIYYTYHATNAFLALYTSFNQVFDEYFEGTPIALEEENYDELSEEEQMALQIIKTNKDFINKEMNREVITDFRLKTISSGRYFDTKLKENGVDIAFDYVSKDLKPVALSTIVNETNNYVNNTIFVLTILINAGLDDDYNSIGEKEYFFNQVQYALMNIRKIYDYMSRKKKEDLISSFSLGDEKCSEAGDIVIQELRKSCKNLSVYDMIPLYCNTYSSVSEFLIQYPQKEMINNVTWILEKRQANRWLWDNEEFNINNNLYYVFALENFYNYFENFESPFVNSAKRMKEQEQKINTLKKDSRDTLQKQKSDFEKEKEKYEKLLEEERSHKSPLEAEVLKMADKVFNERFEKSLETYLFGLIEAGKEFSIKSIESSNSFELDKLKELYRNDPRLQILYQLSWAINDNASVQDKEMIKLTKNPEFSMSTINKSIEKNILNKILVENLKDN